MSALRWSKSGFVVFTLLAEKRRVVENKGIVANVVDWKLREKMPVMAEQVGDGDQLERFYVRSAEWISYMLEWIILYQPPMKRATVAVSTTWEIGV